MSYPRFAKDQLLPVEVTDYGFVQRWHYHQPDLHHEEILELDSPFASTAASGTRVFTFLLLGDQVCGVSVHDGLLYR